jgi:cob(I)alamin adenosyltransferase
VREGVSENRDILRYLNRASTLLYLLARYEDERKGVDPTIAKKGKR